MEPRSPSKSKIQVTGFIHNQRFRKVIWIVILIILILAVIFGCISLKDHILMSGNMSSYFTVVLDCGSTGTRVNVYEWMIRNDGKDFGNLPVLLHSYQENVNKSISCQYHCMQTEPGLHNFVNDPMRVRDSLEPLIRYTEKWVPLERRSETPIFILATAGMRRLGMEDAGRIMEDVENVVKDTGFLYRKTWIRVLSGKEEAYYGWVALNYKMGVLGNSSRFPTLGLLDLGGSSLQVVAEVDVPLENEHAIRSKIGSMEHDLEAYSLPAFGLNEAFDRTIDILIHTESLRESIGGMFEIRHPCLGSSFNQNYTCHGCFGQNFSASKDLSEVNQVMLLGEPNWERCKIIAEAAAINSTKWLNNAYHSGCVGLPSYGRSAGLNLTKMAHNMKHYHALSAFFFVYHALNLNQMVNLTTLWNSGQRLCSRIWADETSLDGQYCFRVPYLASLIENALCLGDTEILVGPHDISWTLGASLIGGEFLWINEQKSQNIFASLKDNELISSPLFTFVFLLFLLLVVYWCQIKLPMPGRKAGASRTSLPSYMSSKRQPN